MSNETNEVWYNLINQRFSEKKTSGKDVVIDWEILDGFNTQGHLFYDANGLQMVSKTLC